MTRHRRWTRPLRRSTLAAGLLLAAVALGACGPVLAGTAAVVGSERITVAQLEREVGQLSAERTRLGLPAATPGQLLRGRLLTDILQQLVAQAAAGKGITVTQGEVDAFLARQKQQLGGEAGLARWLAQNDVPVSAMGDFLRAQVQSGKLVDQAVPGASTQARQQAFEQIVISTSERLGVRVSPRFGSWEPRAGGLVPAPADLSTPAAGTTPGGSGGPAGGATPAPTPSP